MNQRTNKLIHPLGIELSTPLLIPSYSSKGFAIDNGKSEIYNLMSFTKEFVHESQLVSAYDIYHNLMPDIPKLNSTQITFLDSGGYETSNNFDRSETRKYDREKMSWNQDMHNELVDKWTELLPAVLVSFDDVGIRVPINEQIENASLFFQKQK